MIFIGHFAMALGAKRFAPQVSLGVLFLACQLADIIWPNLVLLGFEKLEVAPGITAMTPLNFLHYPYSHSLVALVLWAAVFAVLYTLLRRAGTRVAIVIALLVLSHWILDVMTHRPDMPVALGDSALIGLGTGVLVILGILIVRRDLSFGALFRSWEMYDEEDTAGGYGEYDAYAGPYQPGISPGEPVLDDDISGKKSRRRGKRS